MADVRKKKSINKKRTAAGAVVEKCGGGGEPREIDFSYWKIPLLLSTDKGQTKTLGESKQQNNSCPEAKGKVECRPEQG